MGTTMSRARDLAGIEDESRAGLPLAMGIMNITPDSFSDGGALCDPAAIRSQVRTFQKHRVDILDIGGESTRPGARRITEDLELRRIIPVLVDIACESDHPTISVDTMRAGVADVALTHGATIINDVSGGGADATMLSTVRGSGAYYVIGHWPRYIPPGMRQPDGAGQDSGATNVAVELRRLVDRAVDAGIDPARIFADPGIGFDKNAETNWAIVSNLGMLRKIADVPLVLGVSRKRFLGRTSSAAEPRDRDFATSALHGWIASSGAVAVVRAHNVQALQQALDVGRQLKTYASWGRR